MPNQTELFTWLDSCPTPHHVADMAARLLEENRFESVTQLGADLPANGYLLRDGSLHAWRQSKQDSEEFLIIGAHTDSPNLRINPLPDIARHGWQQLSVEIYGGVLLNSWLDRDLGVAGRVLLTDGRNLLFSDDSAVARIPQLAIHLDRDVNDKGLLLDRQQHLVPVWGTSQESSFINWLATQVNCRPHEIAGFDAQLFDITKAAHLGADRSLIASGRLDNQVSCWAAINALLQTEQQKTKTVIVSLFDHEEVGSHSATGAAGPVLEHLLEALSICQGTSRTQHFDRLAKSLCLSADNAHAVHPNYPERHDLQRAPMVNHGPAIKLNSNQRYATSPRGHALVTTIAQQADIGVQVFVSRNNMPCGSTIGPIAATRLGVETVDIGMPQLSMHSARELCGAQDPALLQRLMCAVIDS
ncbi:putative M18 family aminopeptidase 2 [Actinomycetes bacterium]|nr:putative M18 family aminopeptidase 2 [Actinomycetes bacterium]